MPVTMDDFVSEIERIAPAGLACSWDNSGLLLRCSETVSCVLIALDATMAVAEEAEKKGCDMILAHHPVIFEPVRALDHRNATDAVIMRLVRAKISLYAAHTTYDIAAGGINDGLADKLGLEGIQTVPGADDGFMRIGRLTETCTDDAFLDRVKKVLHVDALRVSRVRNGQIQTVAVAGGSGGSLVASAKAAGAQVLVTGEAKHHHFIEADAQGILLVEAGHFNTESGFAEQIFMSLQSRANELQLQLDLKLADCDIAPYVFR